MLLKAHPPTFRPFCAEGTLLSLPKYTRELFAFIAYTLSVGIFMADSGTQMKSALLKHFQFLILMITALCLVSVTHAENFIVTHIGNSGADSLRNAVATSRDNGEDDIITFSSSLIGDTITLTTGSMDVGRISNNESLTIIGPTANDPNSITIDADDSSQIFVPVATAQKGTLILKNLTLTGGTSTTKGGAIFSNKVNITFEDVLITDNSTTGNSAEGGAVYSKNGSVTLTRTTLSNNSTSGNGSDGGGLYVEQGDATFNQSTISGNSTTGSASEGGGVSTSSGDVLVNQSTFSGNHTTNFQSIGGGLTASFGTVTLNESTFNANGTVGMSADGGAIYVHSVTLTLNQSTVSFNTASGSRGGGIFIDESHSELLSSTIAKNFSGILLGSGICAFSDSGNFNLTLINTILSGNVDFGSAINFCKVGSGSITLNATSSLFGDDSSKINGLSTDVVFNNIPDLGLILDNGGPTKTQLPNPNSPAISAGSNAEAVIFDNDQRGDGFSRLQNGLVEIGAVERGETSSHNNEVLKRDEMAKALLETLMNSSYTPPPFTGGYFDDIESYDFAARWIEDFADKNYTEGCELDNYCPHMVVTREELAQIFGRIFASQVTAPTHTNNAYADVPSSSPYYDWILYFRDKPLTEGCDTNKFCPKQAVTHEWFNFLLDQL